MITLSWQTPASVMPDNRTSARGPVARDRYRLRADGRQIDGAGRCPGRNDRNAGAACTGDQAGGYRCVNCVALTNFVVSDVPFHWTVSPVPPVTAMVKAAQRGRGCRIQGRDGWDGRVGDQRKCDGRGGATESFMN
jgi:hypothetical protein